ncbi:hypothetical protein OQJ26_03095 [Legionella sp. PATHC038]|uniref:hypothetical protein n=1 Tax=Legionella sheltonii TaxID=2992041 RepID=UPI002242EE0A|nr:hypothetical protein [Legionella sp. PATHC038]MCW8397774.1 hypothetical protein [Legionella sp. PATHC038]
MHTFNSGNKITVYKTGDRDLTVVKGVSGVLYPFYKSSGVNSGSSETWFPWMGYLEQHPLSKTDPTFNNKLYMVKPVERTLSEESKGIIRNHLGALADTFISRMGNDEALAISCSFGGGEWDKEKHPGFRNDILSAFSTKKFVLPIKEEDILYKEAIMESIPEVEKDEVVDFVGKGYEGQIMNSHAKMATHVENIIAQESDKYVSSYSIQDEQRFPTTEEIAPLGHARELREKYVGSILKVVGEHRPEREEEKAKLEKKLGLDGDEIEGGIKFN